MPSFYINLLFIKLYVLIIMRLKTYVGKIYALGLFVYHFNTFVLVKKRKLIIILTKIGLINVC